jgi:phage I-like protein
MVGMAQHFRTVPIAIQLAETDSGKSNDAPNEVQIIRCGIFHHPIYGNFKITPDVLESMVKNFSENVRGIDLAIDYEHNSQSVAAGWIKTLKTKNPGPTGQLWADVEWTPKGKQVLQDKEFRYLSADFTLNYEDSETLDEHGPTLFGAGLTNRPFVKGMAPTAQLTEGELEMKTAAELQKELDAANKQLSEQAEEIKNIRTEMKKGVDDVETKKLAERVSTLETENKKLKEEAAKAAEEKKLSEQKTKFDKMLTEGKVVEAQRDAFMSGDMAKFTELAQPVKLATQGNGGDESNKKTVTNKADAETEIDRLARALLSEKKAATYQAAVKMALAENPEIAKIFRGAA